jgi:DNA polymerase-4
VLIARGHGDRDVDETPYLAKSHGREVTYQHNITSWAEVTAQIEQLAQTVAAELGPEQRPAARVVVKVRYAPFVTVTHGVPLPEPTLDTAVIRQAALTALDLFPDHHRPVRLLGVRTEFSP